MGAVKSQRGIRHACPDDPGSLEAARALILEYAELLHSHGVVTSVDEDARDPFMQAKDGIALLLAWEGVEAAGCIVIRRHDDATAELKRLFVSPPHRGTGCGRSLLEQAIEHAQRMGFQRVVLETLPWMREAIRMYEHVGFHVVDPYKPRKNPDNVSMALPLQGLVTAY